MYFHNLSFHPTSCFWDLYMLTRLNLVYFVLTTRKYFYMNALYFIYYVINGHLTHFQVLMITNKTAENIFGHSYVGTYAQFSLRYTSRSQFLEDMQHFEFTKYWLIVLRRGCTNLYSYIQFMTIPVSFSVLDITRLFDFFPSQIDIKMTSLLTYVFFLLTSLYT